ncbi:aspartate aminotransferase family protein [Marinococcus luteus]|uniref:aspartate aminotransferase family protein n=1 Tax=Marinococcus luteus TaxID=1122204 RepID=UPI002ACCB92C|nr:aspartate aminotransferase family protein [Marinococcus luteus]MDZ5782587.1 aspartate aminotransferase family protein [Marinococcus luteus]
MKETSVSRKTTQSRNLYEKAKKVMPGGVTANIKYFSPYPIVMKKGEGSKLYDVDGNEYIDYLLCYGALMTGHGHPRVIEKVTEQLHDAGTTIFGTPHELEIIMAEKLVSLYKSIDTVRYTNSGMEATLLAIRIAAAYTGKNRLAKCEGHYHGGYSQALYSVNPEQNEGGPEKQPEAVPDSSGMSSEEKPLILPFNNAGVAEYLLRANAATISAVILEPVQGGFIPADPGFLQMLRRVTKELGIVLIFDEVKTGFRLGLGGAQEEYGITPDLTALGKVLGGGFPVGAVGGSKNMMEVSSPDGGKDILAGNSSEEGKTLFHSGTYNGHPTVLAAGLETIALLEEPGALKGIFQKTMTLRKGIESLYEEAGIPVQTIGKGSIFNFLFTKSPIHNHRDLKRVNMDFRKQIDCKLLELGIYTKPLNRYSMSIAHTEEDIERTVQAHKQALADI